MNTTRPAASTTTTTTTVATPDASILSTKQDVTAVLITAAFGGVLGLVFGIIRNGLTQFTEGKVESWVKSAFIGFVIGLVIACAAIVVWTLYLHIRRHYVTSISESATQNAYLTQSLAKNAAVINTALPQANSAVNTVYTNLGGVNYLAKPATVTTAATTTK